MKKKIVLTVIAAVAMALSLAGCGVDISSIGLPSDVVIEKGETQQLQIEYSADDKATEEKIAEAAEKLTLEWTSSNEDVATVDETAWLRLLAQVKLTSPHPSRMRTFRQRLM